MFSVDPPLPFACDLISLSFIAGILLLCFLSLAYIFHLRLKSRFSRHLQSFNSLWTVRYLLVSFITLWALNELFRLPSFRFQYLYPFLPSPTLDQRTQICKIHVVLSLGVFEPGFLISLLFLVNVSVNKEKPRGSRAVLFVLSTCLPTVFLQTFFTFFSGWELQLLPEIFQRSSMVYRSRMGDETVLCTYPLAGTVVFGAFVVVYGMWFSTSCFRLVSLVINKALRVRIYVLAITVMVALPLQTVLLGLSVLWTPDQAVYDGVVLVIFLSTLICAAVGQGFLVIRPITDSLVAGGFCPWLIADEHSGPQSENGCRQQLVVVVDVVQEMEERN
ncbi:hypothetical protein HS088_TW19G00893 [Tripterygium wilfordii]|uniref:Uncharacterized protein n=1 Tax=Tripterygium wilfordii TaxID=458696 RepID=A0A7J7CC30_TRIWF|nr:hypothetical protein HS088_TW19G00893 [Tripterygium wilfordii]